MSRSSRRRRRIEARRIMDRAARAESRARGQASRDARYVTAGEWGRWTHRPLIVDDPLLPIIHHDFTFSNPFAKYAKVIPEEFKDSMHEDGAWDVLRDYWLEQGDEELASYCRTQALFQFHSRVLERAFKLHAANLEAKILGVESK